VSLNPTLRWSAEGAKDKPLTYTIAFGRTNRPPVAASGVMTSAYVPGSLQPFTVYYWGIVAADGVHVTVGPIWSFTTETRALLPVVVRASASTLAQQAPLR